jgi:hypothetical protein
MKIWELIIKWSIYLSVVTTAIVIYLNINKIWSRKHEPVVADSISIAAQLISFTTILPFVINYSFQGNYWDAIYQFLWIIYTAFLILVGIGFWVKEHKYLGICQKLFRALKQEGDEVGNLVKFLGNLTGEKQLLAILHHLAWLDGHLDERERKYIQTFTDNLEIPTIDFLEQKPPEEGIEKFNNLRLLVQDYLSIQPPIEQVKLLSDIVRALIAVDEEITLEEEVIAGEIAGIVDEYVNQKTPTVYSIVIHPKTQEQETAIKIAIPNVTEACILGDRALIVGNFHTRRFAEIISETYREQRWFTVVYENLPGQQEHS